MHSTFSEKELKKFCALRGITCNRIREGPKRTPDYELSIYGERIVVEVKEITRNKEEQDSDRLLRQRGYGKVTGGIPGERVRKKISDCSSQIKARLGGIHPSILVLFDYGRGHLDPYQIRVAMYGLEQIYISVPPIGQGFPRATGIGHGPKRKMTTLDNTSVDPRLLASPSCVGFWCCLGF